MANTHTVQGVLGYLMSVIGTRWKVVWAGKLQWMQELDSNFKSLQRRVSIHWMTGDFRRCGCFQVRLNIQRIILWWKSTALRHCIRQWRVWCMVSGLKPKTLNGMHHTGWSKSQSPERSRGGQNWNLRMGNNLFRDRRRMHTCWSRMRWRSASTTEDPCRKIHFMGCFRSVEGL